MSKPTVNQIHVDPLLTELSVAYQNDDYVARQIMPTMAVSKKSGIYYVYDKSQFRPTDDERAPGNRANRVEFGMTQATYGPLVEHALEDGVPDEVADEYPSREQAYEDATENIRDRLLVNEESSLATYMANTANLTSNTTLSGTSQWSDYGNSDPISVIETARNTVRTNIMKRPNTLLLSDPVYQKLRHHPDLLERFKYSERGVLTKDHLAALFEVDKVIVAAAMYNSAAEGATDSMADLWGKHAWLIYVNPRPSRRSVSFGYTMQMTTMRNGQAVPNFTAERWYQGPEKTTFIRVLGNYDQHVVAAGSAYLIKNAVA